MWKPDRGSESQRRVHQCPFSVDVMISPRVNPYQGFSGDLHIKIVGIVDEGVDLPTTYIATSHMKISKQQRVVCVS